MAPRARPNAGPDSQGEEVGTETCPAAGLSGDGLRLDRGSREPLPSQGQIVSDHPRELPDLGRTFGQILAPSHRSHGITR